MNRQKQEMGFIDNGTGKHQSNTVYNPEAVSPTITTLVNGGTQQIKIVACRGRKSIGGGTSILRPVRTEYGKQIRKDYESHAVYEQRKNMQRLESRDDGLTNTITTVQKDNLLMEEIREPTLIGSDGTAASQEEVQNFRENYSEHKKYRIRKLTPRECYRLMGVSDENASKMLSANSNTQCYKQAGNSICVPVLMALFSQMNIGGIKPWNDMTEDEIYELIDSHK